MASCEYFGFGLVVLIEIALYISLCIENGKQCLFFSKKMRKANVRISSPTRNDRVTMSGEAAFGEIRRLLSICSIWKDNSLGRDAPTYVSVLACSLEISNSEINMLTLN